MPKPPFKVPEQFPSPIVTDGCYEEAPAGTDMMTIGTNDEGNILIQTVKSLLLYRVGIIQACAESAGVKAPLERLFNLNAAQIFFKNHKVEEVRLWYEHEGKTVVTEPAPSGIIKHAQNHTYRWIQPLPEDADRCHITCGFYPSVRPNELLFLSTWNLHDNKPKEAIKRIADGARLQHKEQLVVDSSQHYYNFISKLSTKNFHKTFENIFPAADISSAGRQLQAWVIAGPVEEMAQLSDEEMCEAQIQAELIVEGMSDLTVDIMDIISAVWLNSNPSHPDEMVTITADDCLKLRRLKPKRGGEGRYGGYRDEQRQEIERQIGILKKLFIRIDKITVPTEEKNLKKKSRKPKTHSIGGPAIIVSSYGGKRTSGGGIDSFIWRVRPGDIFTKFLLARGRQTLLLSRKAVEYDPYRQKREKRLTRYLAYIWRIRSTKGDLFKPFIVERLLKIMGEDTTNTRPDRLRERFEKTLNKLEEDKVITTWQYEDIDEDLYQDARGRVRRGWSSYWLQCKVAINPPDSVIQHYEKISTTLEKPKALKAPQPDDFAKLVREIRKKRKKNISQVAEDTDIPPAKLNNIERGRSKPTSNERRELQKWLDKGTDTSDK